MLQSCIWQICVPKVDLQPLKTFQPIKKVEICKFIFYFLFAHSSFGVFNFWANYALLATDCCRVHVHLEQLTGTYSTQTNFFIPKKKYKQTISLNMTIPSDHI